MEEDVKDISSESSTEDTPQNFVSQDVKTLKEEESQEEVLSEEPKPKTSPAVPYERFREVNERAKALEAELEALKKSSSLPVTEEELSKKFPDWEFYDEGTREMYRRITTLEREIFNLKAEKAKMEAKARWEEELNKIVNKNPELKAHKEEFMEFTRQEQYKGTPLPVLAELFITKLPKEEKEVPKPGLERSTGGEKIAPPKMTLEDLARLRTKNPKLYFKLIREKRIKEIPEE